MKTNWLIILFIPVLVTSGCPGGGTPPAAPAPGVLAPCGAITGTIIGIGADVTTGISADVNTTFTMGNNTGTSVTWTNGGTGGSTDPVSGSGGTGTIVAVPPPGPPTTYSINLTMTSGTKSINFTGTIIGPPTCTGNGSWTATDSGSNAGSGSWTIP